MVSIPKAPNRQVQRTCSWILEAVLILMNEKPYNKITVSDITNKAGIARQTFYRNYKDKDEVIIEYFSHIFSDEMLTVESVSGRNSLPNIVLTFNAKYMVSQRVNLKKIMSALNLENLFMDSFNKWLDVIINQGKIRSNSDTNLVYRYKVIYQITGILRVIMDWFKNDMPAPVDTLARMLNYLTVDTKAHYPRVPNIKIRIIDR